MSHEVSFLDYEDGLRVGTFDKCNGRPKMDNLQLFARSNLWSDGYDDGWNANEQKIGPTVLSPVEAMWIGAHASKALGRRFDVDGQFHCASAVIATMTQLQALNLLTAMEKPTIEVMADFVSTRWGVDPIELVRS